MIVLGGLGNNLGGGLGGPGIGGGLGGPGLGGGGGSGLAGRDFDSLSAALGGGSGGGGYNSNNMERDFRGPPPNLANNGRDPISDTIIIKNVSANLAKTI